MFSDLGKIFFAQPRHAESADARLHIRRQDPDTGGKGTGRRDDSDDTNADDAEMPVVSVGALRVFLENLLRAANEEAGAAPPAPAADLSSASAGDARHAAAASAYARNIAASVRPAPAALQDAPPAESIALSADEIRSIRGILENLETLSARGVDSVIMERSDTFLGSLESAVEKSLHGGK